MNLNEFPAGYDDPVEALLGFHRRIERQLTALAGLPCLLEERGMDAASMTTAASILDFFSHAMPTHQDDEADLLRILEARGGGSQLGGLMEAEHGELDRAWRTLRRPLEAIAEGVKRTLPADPVRYFRAGHAAHIAFEEGALHVAAARSLTLHDRSALARGMAARRTRSYRFQ